MPKELLDADSIARKIDDIAGRILADYEGKTLPALIGIQTRGVSLAKRIAERIKSKTGSEPAMGSLDITLYRDDLDENPIRPVVKGTDILFDINGREVLLVDDVLFTGRTIRAALDAIADFGRPARVRLATLVDRGNRELPICPDYTGLTISAESDKRVQVQLKEVDGVDLVFIKKRGK
jgi:pyrimidine operon attenuation protein/uracil phosphoribosyltransferase